MPAQRAKSIEVTRSDCSCKLVAKYEQFVKLIVVNVVMERLGRKHDQHLITLLTLLLPQAC